MNKKISLGAAIAFMAVVASITFCVTMLFSQDIFNKMIANVTEKEQMYDKIEEIYTKINDNYLFTLDEEQFLNATGNGIMSGLNDRYARYYTQEEYAEKLKEDKGELVGIGVTVRYDTTNGYLTVEKVYVNSPAEAAGLQKGDVIIQIDDQDLSLITAIESTKLIQGEAGSKLNVVYRRDGVNETVEMVRKNVEIPAIESRMIADSGYIKIIDFTDATPGQFFAAIENLQEQGATSLIFDVRNNGGGTLDSVLEMLDYLLPEGEIATSVDKSGNKQVLKNSDAREVVLPMVTITNGNTASASELFVQALKDYQKADSVGTTTYGKGVIQTTYALSDGSAIKMTTSYFNPPKSENFDGIGIKPNYEVALTKEQEQNFDMLDETNDPQLMKAIEVVNSLTES